MIYYLSSWFILNCMDNLLYNFLDFDNNRFLYYFFNNSFNNFLNFLYNLDNFFYNNCFTGWETVHKQRWCVAQTTTFRVFPLPLPSNVQTWQPKPIFCDRFFIKCWTAIAEHFFLTSSWTSSSASSTAPDAIALLWYVTDRHCKEMEQWCWWWKRKWEKFPHHSHALRCSAFSQRERLLVLGSPDLQHRDLYEQSMVHCAQFAH